MEQNNEPEALVVAEQLENGFITLGKTARELRYSAAATIRRIHARVEELEAMLDAVGAGGVSAQRVTQGKDHTEQQVRELLATGSQPQADALDTERLNWLIEQGCSNGVVYENVFGAFWMVWLDGDDVSKDKHQADRYPTARDAIDAAIAAAKESR